MKNISLILLIVGVIVSALFWSPLVNEETGYGFGALYFGYPLVIIGGILFVISLFSNKNR